MTNKQLADLLEDWARQRDFWDKEKDTLATSLLKEAARRLREIPNG